MTIPTSPGRIVGLLFFAAGIVKMFGLMSIKFAAPELFLAGLLAVAVLP